LTICSGHSNDIYALEVSSDGKHIISSAKDKSLKLWDRETGSCMTTLEVKTEQKSIALFPGKKYIASGGATILDCTVKVWDIEGKGLLRTFQGHSGPVNSIKIFQNGKFFITGSSDKTLKLWDINKEKEYLHSI